MKKIKKSALQLDRDVLRILTSQPLRDVEGGNVAPGTSGCSTPRSPCGVC
jgi:hypothetical protein